MRLTSIDHAACLRACADSRTTDEERVFLSTMASLAAAGEPVSRRDYLRLQALTGGALSSEGPINARPMPAGDKP